MIDEPKPGSRIETEAPRGLRRLGGGLRRTFLGLARVVVGLLALYGAWHLGARLAGIAGPLAPAAPRAAAVPATDARPQADGESDLERLLSKGLLIPVEGVEAHQLEDSFDDPRGWRIHQAIDIMAPRGTPVLATGDGAIAKLFESRLGGITLYQFDPAREFAYYYAHLERYAHGLEDGQQVKRGEVLGYVGSSGNASSEAPHLHFAIYKLGPRQRWWKGEAVNPYLVLVPR